MYLLKFVEWSAGDIQQKDIPARSPAVRAKYVNSKNIALEILRMFVLISTNHYSIHRWNLMFATSSPYRLHHPHYSRDLSHKAGRGLGIRDDKAHGFYNKFTWKVEKLETIFLNVFSFLPSFIYAAKVTGHASNFGLNYQTN